jgi:glutamyl-tRNA synthetase
MDWGNAFVRSAKSDTQGEISSIEMELHLEGDFRKTEKKVTWLAASTESHKLVNTVLLDYDYLITKTKLEEDDKMEDFVTPVTEFREEAFADANVLDVKKGETIQFERKGFYILDGIIDGTYEFIRIPDSKAASLASKASIDPPKPALSKSSAASSSQTQAPATNMYPVKPVYGDDSVLPSVETSMYKVNNIYAA